MCKICLRKYEMQSQGVLKVKVSSLSNKYYSVLKIVFVFLGPAVWPSVGFVRWTNSYSTRAYYTQQTWQCKGGSQGKTGLFVFSLLFSSSSVFFLLAFRLSPSLLFLCGMAWKTSFTIRRISILSSQLSLCLLALRICDSTYYTLGFCAFNSGIVSEYIPF